MRLQKESSRPKVRMSGYTYTNTRVKAMKAKLLKREDFQKFAKMSLAEIARFLQETEYSREISELSTRFRDANLIEYALNKNLENVFSKISGFAMLHAKEQIDLYLMRYDIANIKTILRGKQSGMTAERISNEIIACGSLSREFLEKAARAAGFDEAASFFKKTEYYPILKRHDGNLTKLEDELDKFYYAFVLENAGKEIAAYIRKEIFVRNTLNRLRARKADIKIDIIPGEERGSVPYQEDSIDARIALKGMLIGHALRMVHEVKRNIRPVLGYLIYKENEVANIRLLSRAKHSGLKEEIVSQMVI